MLTKPPDIRQKTDYDCGPAAIRAALACLGVSESVAGSVAALAPATPQDGTPPAVVETLLRRAGFAVQSGDLSLGDLVYQTGAGRPVLCVIQSGGCGHWVCVWRANQRWVYLQDPADGPRRVAASAFLASWHDSRADGLVVYDRWGVAVGKQGGR